MMAHVTMGQMIVLAGYALAIHLISFVVLHLRHTLFRGYLRPASLVVTEFDVGGVDETEIPAALENGNGSDFVKAVAEPEQAQLNAPTAAAEKTISNENSDERVDTTTGTTNVGVTNGLVPKQSTAAEVSSEFLPGPHEI